MAGLDAVETLQRYADAANVIRFECDDSTDESLGEEGKTFTVHSAFYGSALFGEGGASFTDVTEAMQGAVDNGVLAWEGGVHNIAGDPEFGVGKHFIMLYSVY